MRLFFILMLAPLAAVALDLTDQQLLKRVAQCKLLIGITGCRRQRSRRLRSSLLQVVIGVAQEPVDAKHDLSDRRRRHLLLEQRLDEALHAGQ